MTSAGLYSLCICIVFGPAVTGLTLRVRTPGASSDDNQFNFYILEGQSFEAECWPEYEMDYEGELENYSIQFLKKGVAYMAKPMWKDDPMQFEDSIVISGNEVLNPEIPEADRARYQVIHKEHTENGHTVPKYVLSVTNARPEDSGELECFLLENVNTPLDDPYDFSAEVIAEDWGKEVLVLGNIQEMYMFSFSFSKHRYPIALESRFENGHVLTVEAGQPLPLIGCRFFYPSHYPTVQFSLRNQHGSEVQELTSYFHRYHNYNRTSLVQEGPLFKAMYMQDYISQSSAFAPVSKFVVNESHHGMTMWCEGKVVSPTDHSLPIRGVYLQLAVAGMETETAEEKNERKYETEGSDDPIVHLPVDNSDVHTEVPAEKEPSTNLPKNEEKQEKAPEDKQGASANSMVGGNSASAIISCPLVILTAAIFILSA